ncbi:MAG: helix-turn-helix domain-containing protein [Candidatus Margulisbacteria bacterium]|nr:helix-turn-helix domain-containing protein [Candidatus Margulisiibacteriota bacterium]
MIIQLKEKISELSIDEKKELYLFLHNQLNDTLYSIDELMEILNCSWRTVKRSITAGKIKAIKQGKYWKISQVEVDRILSENKK